MLLLDYSTIQKGKVENGLLYIRVAHMNTSVFVFRDKYKGKVKSNIFIGNSKCWIV